ncbi:MAG: zf-TFIIB domain-containing protein [Actinomycetota bacterium]
MTEQLCPGCGLRLTPGRLGPAALDYCSACKGVWLGTAALRELLVSGEEAVRRLQEQVGSGSYVPRAYEPAGGCPGCGVPLAKVVAPDLPLTPVFACTGCRGFWLTAAALDQLAGSRPAHSQVAVAQPGPTPGATPDCLD